MNFELFYYAERKSCKPNPWLLGKYHSVVHVCGLVSLCIISLQVLVQDNQSYLPLWNAIFDKNVYIHIVIFKKHLKLIIFQYYLVTSFMWNIIDIIKETCFLTLKKTWKTNINYILIKCLYKWLVSVRNKQTTQINKIISIKKIIL